MFPCPTLYLKELHIFIICLKLNFLRTSYLLINIKTNMSHNVLFITRTITRGMKNLITLFLT